MAASEEGSLVFNGKKPIVSILASPSVREPLTQERPAPYSRAISEPIENANLEKPSLGRRRSHQRNTITIDTVTPLLGLVNPAPLVSPDDSRMTLRPNVFVNIPARSPAGLRPTVFDASAVSPDATVYAPLPTMAVRE